MPRTLRAAGLVAYAGSFGLIAVNGFEPHRGYLCAVMALWAPVAILFGGQPDMQTGTTVMFLVGYPSMLAAGLVNIAFPFAIFLRLAVGRTGLFRRLQVYIPLMMACSWIVFLLLRFLPREGHLLWIAGIGTTLFADEIAAASGWKPREGSPRRARFTLYR